MVKILIILFVISMQFAFMLFFRTDNTWGWDFDEVVNLAKCYVNHKDVSYSYLATYSTNILYFWLVVTIFRISKFFWGECSTILLLVCNVLTLDISIVGLYYIAKSWRNKVYAQTVCIVCVFFIPYWLYLPIAYQDIFSMPLYILPVLLYTLCQKKYIKDNLAWLLIGIISGIGFYFKGNTLIALIALCIFSALSIKHLKTYLMNLAIASIGFLVTFLVIKLLICQMTIITPEEVQSNKVPFSHLVYMGLVGDGSWNADIVAETMSIEDYEEKKEYTTEKIRQKICEYGFEGLLGHITLKESTVMFNKGTLNGDLYINRNPRHEHFVHYIWQDDTRINHILMYFCQSYWRMLLILCICGSFFRIKICPPNDYMNIAYLIMFGTILFFAFWESNSRYILNSSYYIILIATDVIEICTNKLVSYRKEKNE